MFHRSQGAQPRRAPVGWLASAVLVLAACTSVSPAAPATIQPTVAPPTTPPMTIAPPTAAPASAAPTASASTFVCEQETTGCAGPLSPGEHHTALFDHPFTFTIPATGHWSNVIDKARSYHFRDDEAPFAEFNVWSQAAPEAQAKDCDAREREPGYGTTMAEWLRYLEEHRAVDVLSTETFQVDGRDAIQVVVGVKPSWTRMCPGNTDPFAFLVTDTGDPPTRGHGTGGQASMTFIDFGDDALVIWNDGGDVGSSQMVDLALPVIRSIHFDTSP